MWLLPFLRLWWQVCRSSSPVKLPLKHVLHILVQMGYQARRHSCNCVYEKDFDWSPVNAFYLVIIPIQDITEEQANFKEVACHENMPTFQLVIASELKIKYPWSWWAGQGTLNFHFLRAVQWTVHPAEYRMSAHFTLSTYSEICKIWENTHSTFICKIEDQSRAHLPLFCNYLQILSVHLLGILRYL